MPSANKAKGVFDSGKTYSYHIKAVSSYAQSTKSSASFKLIFKRDAGDKRYDLEAETAREAGENRDDFLVRKLIDYLAQPRLSRQFER